MDVTNIASLILFFLPGYITLRIYDFFTSAPPRDYSKAASEILGFSIFTYIALFWIGLINPSGVTPHSWLALISNLNTFYSAYGWFGYLCFFILAIAVMPSILAGVVIKLRASRYFKEYVINANLEPWEHVAKGNPYWVILHLKDGRKIGGKFDKDSGSFASTHPANEQIYLGEVWWLNEEGQFDEKAKNNGLLVFGEEISAVEFYSGALPKDADPPWTQLISNKLLGNRGKK